MTRVIGGVAGGRRIRTPHGDRTRPTTDRVREALFSALESEVGALSGLRFLDLYAGSGAVGLEAASRGAAGVTLVEQHRRTARLAGENALALGLSDRVEVVARPVRTALATPPAAPYAVVFADPPYPLPDPDLAADLAPLAGPGWLLPGAVVVVERPSRGGPTRWPAGLTATRTRRYGETALHFARAWPAPPAAGPDRAARPGW